MYPHHYFHQIGTGGSFDFWKDVLPVLISSVALLVSVIVPYLIIRYEKIYAANKEHKEFLRQIEIYLLEWLNITAYDARTTNEFLDVLKTPGAIFPKNFQFYDFPSMDFFKSYNVELVNEVYVIIRKLKGFDHHLRMIDNEYQAFKRTIMSGGGKLAENVISFFNEALGTIDDQYPKVIEDLTDLRVKVRLLLNDANKTDTLKMKRFYGFGKGSRIWYKNDLRFTDKELSAERAVLEKEQADGARKE
ncbi:MAG: hypothetical protein ABSE76_00485 [Minisyncoccia bacterium]|jgi:hypothetical protein